MRTLILIGLVALTACAGRNRAPRLNGGLGDVVVRSSFTGESAPARFSGALILDSLSFGALAVLVQQDLGSISRPVEFADANGLMECPDRRPCYLRDDRVYMNVWDAVAADDSLVLVVGRTHNVQRLFLMNEVVAHRIKLQREGSGWRLVRRQKLPT